MCIKIGAKSEHIYRCRLLTNVIVTLAIVNIHVNVAHKSSSYICTSITVLCNCFASI